MSAKTDKSKKGKKKNPNDGPSLNTVILKKLLQFYEQSSLQLNSKSSPDIVKAVKECLETDDILKKIILRPIPKDLRAEDRFLKAVAEAESESNHDLVKELKSKYQNPPNTFVSPLMKAISSVQLALKQLYIFDMIFTQTDMIAFVYSLRTALKGLETLELLDCLLTPLLVSEFAPHLNNKIALTNLTLDYNEFGDEGCKILCKGLIDNRSLLSLSLNYCKLTSASGAYIAEILNTTALKDIYLDGNELGCRGALDLISDLVLNAEQKIIAKQLEEERLAEEKRKQAEENAKKGFDAASPTEPQKDEKNKKKKKKKKKGKKKKTNEPPPVGSFACKIHIADNIIDYYENGADRVESMSILHQTIEMFCRLIKSSEEIAEIDLHNNAIGNMGARMLLDALEFRKKKKMGSIGLRVTEKIDQNLFAALMKAGKKIKKKKKKKKKKS